MVWVTPDWNAGVDGRKRRGRVEQMSAPGMNTVPERQVKRFTLRVGAGSPVRVLGQAGRWRGGVWQALGARLGVTRGHAGQGGVWRAGATSSSSDPQQAAAAPSCLSHALLSVWLSGFVEAELKKLLVVQRESRLWKMGG